MREEFLHSHVALTSLVTPILSFIVTIRVEMTTHKMVNTFVYEFDLDHIYETS